MWCKRKRGSRIWENPKEKRNNFVLFPFVCHTRISFLLPPSVRKCSKNMICGPHVCTHFGKQEEWAGQNEWSKLWTFLLISFLLYFRFKFKFPRIVPNARVLQIQNAKKKKKELIEPLCRNMVTYGNGNPYSSFSQHFTHFYYYFALVYNV